LYWYNGDIEWLENKPVETKIFRKVVFYGSSTFTRWESLETDFKEFQAVNLGFGGSTLAACAWFFDRVVPRQHPDAIFIYAGDNDLGDGRSPEEVILFYFQLIANIRIALGNIPICYVSIKLSPIREHLKGSIEYANQYIKDSIVNSKANTYFLDIYHRLLDDHGNVEPSYYEPDGLHLSEKGYTLLRDAINDQFSFMH
jgi:lysophospholipase L1-like esterase